MSGGTEVFVIHGYGVKDGTKFQTAERLRRGVEAWLPSSYRVSPFRWDSGGMFAQARLQARTGGEELQECLNRCERAGTDCHVIGYSLGAEVIRHSLDLQTRHFACLRGIFLVGAAIPCETQINERVLDSDVTCCNYHSPFLDSVLGWPYILATGRWAAGKVGLWRTRYFRNIAVACSHFIDMFVPSYAHLAQRIAGEIARR